MSLARPDDLWRRRAQPAYHGPRARHSPRTEAFRCDGQSPGDAARRWRLVPQSGFIHIDTGPIQNWTLDQRGLEGLLIFDGRRLRFDGTSQVLLGGPWRPLTVAQRLTLQYQLARAEFLARIGLRVSP